MVIGVTAEADMTDSVPRTAGLQARDPDTLDVTTPTSGEMTVIIPRADLVPRVGRPPAMTVRGGRVLVPGLLGGDTPSGASVVLCQASDMHSAAISAPLVLTCIVT